MCLDEELSDMIVEEVIKRGTAHDIRSLCRALVWQEVALGEKAMLRMLECDEVAQSSALFSEQQKICITSAERALTTSNPHTHTTPNLSVFETPTKHAIAQAPKRLRSERHMNDLKRLEGEETGISKQRRNRQMRSRRNIQWSKVILLFAET